jgi:hypothetical protein
MSWLSSKINDIKDWSASAIDKVSLTGNPAIDYPSQVGVAGLGVLAGSNIAASAMGIDTVVGTSLTKDGGTGSPDSERAVLPASNSISTLTDSIDQLTEREEERAIKSSSDVLAGNFDSVIRRMEAISPSYAKRWDTALNYGKFLTAQATRSAQAKARSALTPDIIADNIVTNTRVDAI